MEIILHVGHGKTGTSYIQTALALADLDGITYPILDHQVDKARRGKLTSGNIRYEPACFKEMDAERLLLSSESMFKPLVDGKLIPEIRGSITNPKITILLFVRNPLENAASSYRQAVQKGLEDRPFSDFLDRFNRPRQVANAIRNLDGATMKVANFSKCRKTILSTMSMWLGVDIPPPPNSLSNRSLTAGEAAFIARLNKHLPRGASNNLGSRLCSDLPYVTGPQLRASIEVLKNFQKRMQDQIQEVHELLGYDLYEVEDVAAFTGGEHREFIFSAEQLDLMAEIIAGKWK